MRPKASGALQTVVTLADCYDEDDDYQGCGDDNGDEKHDPSNGDYNDCIEGSRDGRRMPGRL